MTSESSLPGEAPVVVIGGGVMGLSTLYHLAREGITDAILVERDQLTSGTTWHSAAQVRALRSSRNLTELARYSIALYRALEEETGQGTGWINAGSLSIATTPDRMIHVRRQEALAHLFGLAAEWLSPAEAAERWPLMRADDLLGAVWSSADGRVGASDLAAALAKGARARGAGIFEETRVTGLLTRRGRIAGVETDRGTVRTGALALCAGLWSRDLAAMAGYPAPLWPCEHYYLLTGPVPGLTGNLPTLGDHDAHLYIRDDSGGLLVGCFEPRARPLAPGAIAGLKPFQLLPEDWDHFEPMLAGALHRIPALAEAGVRMLLNGPESFTPDGMFLLGEAAETPGLYMGCGMNSVGVATGGGAGMALARLIARGRLPFDLPEAEPNRFAPEWNDAAALAARAPEVLGRHYEIAYPGRQFRTARPRRRLPLHALWEAEGAHFGEAFGWERPLWFGPPVDPRLTFARPAWFAAEGREVAAAHGAAALFELSTFGKIEVEGPDAEAFLDRVLANDMRRPAGRVIYSPMLDTEGGYVSDVTAQRLGREHYRIFTGTTAVRRGLGWLARHAEGARVALRDASAELAVLGLMGPDAGHIARTLGAGALAEIGWFRHGEVELAGVPVRAARLSYVGEAGWELTCAAADAPRLARALIDAGARPAGLNAQTSMRIEKGFLAMGHELDADITPLEAGLDFALCWERDFIGREALLRRRDAGLTRRIVTVLLADTAAVPLGGEPVRAGGAIVGKTTSAAFGHRIGRPVALALVDAALGEGDAVEVDIARDPWEGRITLEAAFDPAGERMRRAQGAER